VLSTRQSAKNKSDRLNYAASWSVKCKLHKKVEALCLVLGDKNGFQASYGNQAVILQAWDWLEEAMALGNKEVLQAIYGNRALILKAWGRLEEAMALLKKAEALCLELGSKDGLQTSYGNQAVILEACGRLEEAMAPTSKAFRPLPFRQLLRLRARHRWPTYRQRLASGRQRSPGCGKFRFR
jgi:tetratricopeptide (TPR) repeat protein